MVATLAGLCGANKVVLFSWVTCPFCVAAEKLLAPMTNDMKIHYVDKMSEGKALREEIYKEYKHETVPAIFIKGQFVGGFSEVDELNRSGKLAAMLG